MKKKQPLNLKWSKALTTLTFTLLLFASSAIKAKASEPIEKEKSVCLAKNSNWNLPNFENSNSITIQFISCVDPSAQCTYVTIGENSTETRVAIPCDFPVLMKTADGKNDYVTYSEQMAIWRTNHPGINVGPSPSGAPTNSYVEIPTMVFNLFSTDKQTVILAAPIYYHVK